MFIKIQKKKIKGLFFLSYNWNDNLVTAGLIRGLAIKIDSFLGASACTLDKRDLVVGDKISDFMKKGIESAKVFVPFITQRYYNSMNCLIEAEHAFTTSKNTVPVIIKGAVLATLPNESIIIDTNFDIMKVSVPQGDIFTDRREKLIKLLDNYDLLFASIDDSNALKADKYLDELFNQLMIRFERDHPYYYLYCAILRYIF